MSRKWGQKRSIDSISAPANVSIGKTRGRASASSEQAVALGSMSLSNIANIHCKGTDDNRATAMRTFEKYIEYINLNNPACFPLGTLEELENNPDYFTDNFFGAFPSYMRSDQCPKVQKLDANLHYLSSVKC